MRHHVLWWGVEIKAKDFSIEMSSILSSLLVEHDLTFLQFKVPHHIIIQPRRLTARP